MSQVTFPFLPNPSKTIIIDVYKPQGRPAEVTASEVEMTDYGFTYIPFQDKHHRIPLGGNNTAKNREAGINRMIDELRKMGWIE